MIILYNLSLYLCSLLTISEIHRNPPTFLLTTLFYLTVSHRWLKFSRKFNLPLSAPTLWLKSFATGLPLPALPYGRKEGEVKFYFIILLYYFNFDKMSRDGVGGSLLKEREDNRISLPVELDVRTFILWFFFFNLKCLQCSIRSLLTPRCSPFVKTNYKFR